MDDRKSDAFVIHCNNMEDNAFVSKTLVPLLHEKGFKIFLADTHMPPGSEILHGITKGIHESRKTLVVLTERSLESEWCTFETIVAFEKAQRQDQMSVILLLKGITKDKLPPSGVLHVAPSVDVCQDGEGWKTELLKYMNEKVQMPLILQSGNIAHGLVWSHFMGLLDHILPELGEMIKETEIYKSNPSRFPLVLYELIPDDCELDIVQGEKTNTNGIKFECSTKKKVKTRAGNLRIITLNIYSVTDTVNGEKYFFIAEHPSVLSTILYAEKISKEREKECSREHGADPEKALQHNLSLHLARFSYTMQMVLDHPELKIKWKGCKARLVHFKGEEKRSIADTLLKAIKEDVGLQKESQETFLEENIPESQREPYEYDAYICCSKKDYVEEKKIREYLQKHGVDVAVDETGKMMGNEALIRQSRWLIFPLSKEGMHDHEFTLARLSAIMEAIDRGSTLVIPIILEEDREFGIPEVLRWVTYIQKMTDDKGEYLDRLLKTIKGGPVPMDLKSYLPAGNVAYGLALGYVTNYLKLVLPGLLPAVRKLKEVECQPYLFVLIPTSCNCKDTLDDARNPRCTVERHKTRIVLYTSPEGREYSCDVYRIKTDSEEVYFLGLYAAPISCLQSMIQIHIGGLKEDEMMRQRHEFCSTLNSLLHAELDRSLANCCRFIEYNDVETTVGEAVLGEINKIKRPQQ